MSNASKRQLPQFIEGVSGYFPGIPGTQPGHAGGPFHTRAAVQGVRRRPCMGNTKAVTEPSLNFDDS